MSKRLIGIDIAPEIMRIAIAEQGKQGFVLRSFAQRTAATNEQRAMAIAELLGNLESSDRVAAALPACVGYQRRLSLPFSDPKKLASVLRYELDSQVPQDISDAVLVHSKAVRKDDNLFEVQTIAVPREKIIDFLAPFEQSGAVLATLDISPAPFVMAYAEKNAQSLILSLTETEACLCACNGTEILEFRTIAKALQLEAPTLHPLLLRELEQLARQHELDNPALKLIGSGITQALQAFMDEHSDWSATVPELFCEGAPLPASFLPAAALARRSDRSRGGFNFRTGEFALQSQWSGLKKPLIAAALCVILSVGVFATDAYLNYARKSQKSDRLQELIHQQFRQSFPGVRNIVNAPAQMQAKLKESRERMRNLGLLGEASALSVLREISEKTPADMKVDIRNFLFDPESVRIEGTTSSFEAVNLLSAALESSELILEVQITDAKMSVDGRQINFRLTLNLQPSQEQS